MIVTCLVENHNELDETQMSHSLKAEHGLSLFIQTKQSTILFDFGASDAFVENAQALNVDLKMIDFGVLSHGHYDHGGGISSFLKENDCARIFIKSGAFDCHISERAEKVLVEIGLDQALLEHSCLSASSPETSQLVILDESFYQLENAMIFSDVSEKAFYPNANASMFTRRDGQLEQDNFSHEQHLIVSENGFNVLFAGCAHQGILNIVHRASEHIGKMPDVVFAGFHLTSKRQDLNTRDEDLLKLGQALKDTGATYYTGHCTGEHAFEILKTVMGEQIKRIFTGFTWSDH